jgi:hypothetical protein
MAHLNKLGGRGISEPLILPRRHTAAARGGCNEDALGLLFEVGSQNSQPGVVSAKGDPKDKSGAGSKPARIHATEPP